MRRLLIVALLAAAPGWAGCVAASLEAQPAAQAPAAGPAAAAVPSQPLRLPLANDSVKFAVLGDTGTGDSKQQRVADQLTAWRAKFPYEFAIMTGDNIYGTDNARNFRENFEEPYQALLAGGVKFYASLGNHDDPNQRLYKPFNMGGQRYYSFKPKDGVRFFALDTNYVDDAQIKWLEEELMASGSDWKIAFFHHPLYSSGETHGSADLQREKLEPIFVKHGVNVVFAGHEHFYERVKPQKGIAYFTIGNSAKLRRGDLKPTNLTAKGWDQGYAFMLVEIVGDELFFQVIDEAGRHIDAGSVRRVGDSPQTPSRTTQPVAPGAAAPKK
jgi:hypothetical protein